MNSNKKQIVVIHGGSANSSYEEYLADLKAETIDLDEFRKWSGWKDNLGERLGSEFDVLLPQMPNKENAKYAEWKIWFDKIVPLLNKKIILIGHSLGGIFLAKYVSENILEGKEILATFLVAAPYQDSADTDSIADFVLSGKFDLFQEQSDKIFIYHSEDDPVVPFLSARTYQADIEKAELVSFTDRGHFFQSDFPELEKEIKTIFK